MRENTDQKKLRIWTLFRQWMFGRILNRPLSFGSFLNFVFELKPFGSNKPTKFQEAVIFFEIKGYIEIVEKNLTSYRDANCFPVTHVAI